MHFELIVAFVEEKKLMTLWMLRAKRVPSAQTMLAGWKQAWAISEPGLTPGSLMAKCGLRSQSQVKFLFTLPVANYTSSFRWRLIQTTVAVAVELQNGEGLRT